MWIESCLFVCVLVYAVGIVVQKIDRKRKTPGAEREVVIDIYPWRSSLAQSTCGCTSRSSSGPCEVMSCMPHLSCATPPRCEDRGAGRELVVGEGYPRGWPRSSQTGVIPLGDRGSPRCLASLCIPATPCGASDFQRHLINPIVMCPASLDVQRSLCICDLAVHIWKLGLRFARSREETRNELPFSCPLPP